MVDFEDRPPEQNIAATLRRIEEKQDTLLQAMGILLAKTMGAQIEPSAEFMERLGLKVSRVVPANGVLSS